jgi:hypothetical protein
VRLAFRLPRLLGRSADHRITHQIDELIALVERFPDADEHTLVASLLRAGVGQRSARRLVVLVTSAVGRDHVARLGVRVDPHIDLESEDGSRRTVRLDSFAEFRVAVRLIPRLRDSAGYQALARRSSEVDAIRELRRGGTSDFTGVVLTPSLTTWDL